MRIILLVGSVVLRIKRVIHLQLSVQGLTQGSALSVHCQLLCDLGLMADLRVRSTRGVGKEESVNMKVKYRAVESPIVKGKASGEEESKK